MLNSTNLRHTLPLAIFLAVAACSGDDDDTTATTPTVVSTVPTDGATDVAVGTAISVTFSVAMNEGVGSLTLTPGGPLSGSWSAENTRFTAMPSTELLAGTTYTVSLTAFAGADGAKLDTTSFSFTTAAVADVVKPRVLSTMPGDNSTDVPVNLNVVRIVFSEAMNTTNGNATIDGGATIGTATWSAGDTTVSYDLSGLAAGTAYAISLTGYTDVAGNTFDPASLGNDRIDFTTADGADTTPPVVVMTVPAEGATDVTSGTTNIVISFSEVMDNTVGTAILTGSSTVTLTPMWNGDNSEVTFNADLAGGVTYALTLTGFSDVAQNALDGAPYLTDGVLDFATIADTTAPTVVNSTPAEGTPNTPVAITTIAVEFSEAMSSTSTMATFEDVTLGATSVLPMVWTDSRSANFDITGVLRLGRTYRLDLRAFQDVAGNALDPTTLGDGWLDFTTPPDNVAPTVVASTPVEGDTGVFPTLQTIVVEFSEPVNPASIGATLSDGTNTTNLVGTLAADQRTASYSVTLAISTSYMLDLTGVMDIAGNALNGLTYLGDGLLDFAVPTPPTGFDCTSPLTVGYATTVVNGVYTFDITGSGTGSNGSFLCDASGVGDDIVFQYDKQSDTLANGGELLHVSAVSANTTGFNVEVLSGACTVGASSTQHHCYWNNTDVDVYLDVPAGTYWIWVGRNTTGAFQGGTVEIAEIPPIEAEGESCWLPWDTNSSIYTAPATANDPHVWTIPATAINAFDMDVTWGGVGSISCDDHPTYGDIHGADTVISYTPTDPNALVLVNATGLNDTVNVEVLDRCESRDPGRMSLACAANVQTTDLVVPPGTSPIWIWLSTEATGDHWPGATVEVREIVPALGESCATARPITTGQTTINPASTTRLGAPGCFAGTGNLEWYRYTVANGRVQINANAGSEVGVINSAGAVDLGCSATPSTLGVGRVVPVGTQLCIAVPVGSSTQLTITDTPDVYAGVGTNTATVTVTPVSNWNTDYWMAASPNWIYFGRSGGDVQRFPNPVTAPTAAVEVFTGSLNVGYAAVALPNEQLFSLDNTTSSSNNRLFRLWDGASATFTAQPWDLTPSYPTQDMRALTTDGTNLIYATQATNNVEIFSVPMAAAQSPTALGTNTVIDNVYGIAADATYLYFTGISVADNVDGLYRLLRSELGNPTATPELMLAIDIATTAQPIYLDDPTNPTYLYVREGNPADIHVIELPGSTAPVYRGVIADLGVSADYAWTFDASSNSIYLFETETVSTGRIVRVF